MEVFRYTLKRKEQITFENEVGDRQQFWETEYWLLESSERVPKEDSHYILSLELDKDNLNGLTVALPSGLTLHKIKEQHEENEGTLTRIWTAKIKRENSLGVG